MLLLLCLLLALALFALWRACRKTAAALVATALLALVLGSTPWLPGRLVRGLQAGFSQRTPAQWGQRPLIVVLGMGTERDAVGAENSTPAQHASADSTPPLDVGKYAYSSLLAALDLYHACAAQRGDAACHVLVSGGDPLLLGRSEAQVYAQRLIASGMPAQALLIEGASRNTFENAKFSAALVQRQHFDQIVLVASALHLRRSVIDFRHFGLNVVPLRPDTISPSPRLLPNAGNLFLTDAALHEYLGIAQYHAYQALGWN
ncbi:MAG: YdcF family protein [Proteobacteria bacterium]|nr:YdcF family protein [Pseudomonadota bacterium]